MKINISLDDELLERVDSFADSNYMTRSGLISLALVQYLNTNEMTLAIKDLSLAVRKIADEQECDDETLRKLEDFERVARLLVPAK